MPFALFRVCRRGLLLAVVLASLLVSATAFATGLQVSPVSLTIPARERAGGIWLSNTGDNQVSAQARVFRWTQEGNEDVLTPSQDLVVSPPMLQLAPNTQQLIRVIRTGAPPSGDQAGQEAYRLIINELPAAAPVDGVKKKSLQMVLRYSIPVFLDPVGVASPQPQLSWSFTRKGAEAELEVSNTGAGAAQIADVVFNQQSAGNSSGQPFSLGKGLVGYVLPQKTRRWKMKIPADMPAAMNGAWSVMINSVIQTPTIPIRGNHP